MYEVSLDGRSLQGLRRIRILGFASVVRRLTDMLATRSVVILIRFAEPSAIAFRSRRLEEPAGPSDPNDLVALQTSQNSLA
jgi:hypothetical protein